MGTCIDGKSRASPKKTRAASPKKMRAMDCMAATQGTELDPSFKGDWTTRAVGVACSLDDVVPTWIALHPALGYRKTGEDDSTGDGDNKRWVYGPVFKVQAEPAEPLDLKAPLPREDEPRSEFKVRDLLDGEKRTYPTIDALREALKPGDWPMRNVVSVNLGAVTPSEALTKFVSEELGGLAPKLEYLDISSLTHRSFTHVELARTIKSAQCLRVLLMPRDFGPSFRSIEFHPWLEYVRFARRCDDVGADVDAILANCQKIERLDFTDFEDPGGRKGARSARRKIRSAKAFWASGGGRVPPLAGWRPETFAIWTDSVYATVASLKGERGVEDKDDPSRIVDCLDDAEWNEYVEDYVEDY